MFRPLQITLLIIAITIYTIASVLPHQSLTVPQDKYSDVISILKDTGYYKDPRISSVTFTSTKEVTEICEMPKGRIAIGCTQPHPLYSYTYDIWISNEDSDWRNTLYHEIGHVNGGNETEANLFMVNRK